jgi:3-hydroxybutyrate dehydrogenase
LIDTFKIEEPQIIKDEILLLDDPCFTASNVCIISGAGSGIGRALAIAAAANGLLAIGLDVNKKAGEAAVETARALGGRMQFIQADLTKDEDIEKAIRQSADLGNIRYLANIAGIQHVSPIEDFPIEKYDYMHRLMLRAPFYLSKLAIPYMKKNRDGCGVIGSMCSIHAHICTVNKAVYAMMKFGLRGLTQAISAEGQGKIRSFSVTTPYVKTPLALKQIPDQARTRNITEQQVVEEVMLGKSRVKELMNPIEAANIFMYGFSRYAKFLAGSDLMIDGGMVLTY